MDAVGKSKLAQCTGLAAAREKQKAERRQRRADAARAGNAGDVCPGPAELANLKAEILAEKCDANGVLLPDVQMTNDPGLQYFGPQIREVSLPGIEER